MSKMNPNRSNKDSGATEDSNAKKGLQMDSDSSEQPKDHYDGSDEYEESDLSSGSSQDSTTQSSEDSDSSSGSSEDSPPPEIPIPEALLKVDPNDQQSVVNAIGLLVNRINTQLDAIQSKVFPKSPLDFVGLVRQKKLWKMRQRDKAQMEKSSE
ncbi:uncharacterized protein LOC117139603 [Drosophila mauritiana]|uniref:Uncharacterized protein LOC117139603 n=1 Tax=Drosophila mauritiana TaxID=7226 RepID=A0A6P8JNG5_DROMA|nr:uncharacterized protein LOC117139603 [Drosophila mauritiana]XP_033157928.1 uncharacterized protein LOC117139603 [Drosophila mauritiana]